MKKTQIEISWNTLWRILIFVGIIVLFYIARSAIGVLFTAVVLSLGVDPMVSWLEKKGMNRVLGTIVVFVASILVVSAFLYIVIPPIALEAQSFISQFNKILSTLFGIGIPESVIQSLSTSLNNALGFLTSASVSITGTISVIIEKIVLFLSVIVISFYLAIEKNGTERLLRVILPRIYEDSVLKVFSRFKQKIRLWIVAQLGLSLIVGTMVALGLWALDVRYAVILGLIAAVFELVPVIGPILSGLIAFLVAIPTSFTLGLYVIALFFIIQQVENNFLIPYIMQKAMRIHPVIVLIALIAGGQAAGFIGILLSVPIALLVQEIFNYLAEQKNNHSRESLGI